MIFAFLTRFADMVHVLSRRRWGARWSWTRAPRRPRRLAPPPRFVPRDGASGREEGAQSAPAEQETADGEGRGRTGKGCRTPHPPPTPAPPPAADPSQTRRVAPVEVFKDPAAQAILDLGKVVPLPRRGLHRQRARPGEGDGGEPEPELRPPIVDRVVRGLAARLTDKKNIQALLEMPEEDPKAAVPKKGAAPKKPQGDGGKAIEEATTASSTRSFAPGGPRTTIPVGLPADPQPVPAPAAEESSRAPRCRP